MLGPVILVKWKMLIKKTPVLTSDLYLNVGIGKKIWWEYIECDITYKKYYNYLGDAGKNIEKL